MSRPRKKWDRHFVIVSLCLLDRMDTVKRDMCFIIIIARFVVCCTRNECLLLLDRMATVTTPVIFFFLIHSIERGFAINNQGELGARRGGGARGGDGLLI